MTGFVDNYAEFAYLQQLATEALRDVSEFANEQGKMLENVESCIGQVDGLLKLNLALYTNYSMKPMSSEKLIYQQSIDDCFTEIDAYLSLLSTESLEVSNDDLDRLCIHFSTYRDFKFIKEEDVKKAIQKLKSQLEF